MHTYDGTANRLDTWLALYVVAPYRFCNMNNQDHINRIEKVYKEQLRKYGMPEATQFDKFWDNARNLVADVNYIRMMAAIDMYLVRFPLHPLAHIRLGTIPARYKDCAALLSIFYIRLLTGLTSVQLGFWMWVPALSLEYATMLKNNEEISEVNSYMPYMIELGLSTKSPYSTIKNPNAHLFFHIIGASIGNNRSINARVPKDATVLSVRGNAAIVAYVCQKLNVYRRDLVKVGSQPDSARARPALEVEETDDIEAIGYEPTDADPDSWWGYLSDQNHIIP